MTLLCRHLLPNTNLSISTAQEIVNWVTTADGCVHTANTRRNFVRCWQICSDSSRLSPTSCELSIHRRRDSTQSQQLSRVGLAVCIRLNSAEHSVGFNESN